MGNLEDKFRKGIELCNRTACQTSKRVFMYHKTRKSYYCVRCARAINDACIGQSYYPLCTESQAKRDYEDNYKQHFTWTHFLERDL
jgi:hypothetical protein